MFGDCSCERLCFLEAMESFLEKWGATSFQNARGGDSGTSTLTTSKSSSSSSKMAVPENKVKKETVKKDKKEKENRKDKEDKKKAAKSEASEVKKEDGWPSGLPLPPPPPNLKAEPVATTESSEIRPGFTPRKAGSTRDLSMHFFGYKRRAGGWKHNPKRARGRGRS